MAQCAWEPLTGQPDRRRRLCGRVVPRAQVDVRLTARLWHLFARFYLHVERDRFEEDQAEKDWVLLLEDAAGTVQGFTTLKLYTLEVQSQPIRAVFSGNTIIDREFWGEQELVATWCRFMAGLKHQQPELPLFWFLICSGYRTYLFLPLFFHDFYPRYDRPTPAFERAVIETLGRLKFPDEYQGGVVHASQPRECLVPEFAAPRPTKLNNPHVRFLLEQNPGYRRGDELVCITEFSMENTKRLAHDVASEVLG